MKICYIWIEKFRNLENLGLNLSSSIKFNFDKVSNKISCKKFSDLPQDFFGPNITDVMGIIGKNGSGKSNALELICKVLKGGKSDINNDFFVITEEDNVFFCYCNFNYRPVPQSSFNLTFLDHPGKINPLKVVFFSNVFDDKRNDFNIDVSDISVNNLASKKYFLTKKKVIRDFEKQINFINSRNFSTLEIDLPTEVLLTNKIWVNRHNFSQEKYLFNDNYEKIIEIRKFFRSRVRDLVPHNKLIQIIKFGFFFEIYERLIKNYGRGNEFGFLIGEFDKFIKSLYFEGNTDVFTDILIDFIEKMIFLDNNNIRLFSFVEFDQDDKQEKYEKYEKRKPLIIEQINFIKDLKYFISNIYIDYHLEGKRRNSYDSFIIEYKNKDSITYLNEFIRLFEGFSFIDINWLGISSGHRAYLNLFSSIHEEIKYLRTQNLLICIDEGDLYLHPKWQVEFLSKLLKVLPNIYSGNIQLILSSHSPFLLSDLPKNNLTILDKELQNFSLDGVDLKINTFGGNLYDLYSEPFFLGDKRTSDFAFSKIKYLIEKVENKKYTDKEKQQLIKLSNLIGDEIIQFRINKLLKND